MEQRRRRAPGVQAHLATIRDINNQINTLTERIAEYKAKIDSEMRRTNERSESSRIRSEIRSLDDAIRSLKISKSACFDERSGLNTEFNALREGVSTEKRRISFGSVEELERREKEINYKLMTSKVTPQQEKEIGTTLSEIKKKRIDLQSLGSKEAKLSELGKRLGELNEAIKAINAEVAGKKKRIEDLRAELKSLSEKGSARSDAVVEYEKKIEEFKEAKGKLYEKRRAEQAEIAKKEEAHEKYLKALAELQEQENQRKAVQERIRRLDDDRNALLSEQASFDPSKFDEIAESLRCITAGKDLVLPMGLVQRLSVVGVPIPKSRGDVEDAIRALAKMKADFRKTSCDKLRALEEKITDLDIKISDERKALEAMPNTDIRIRKETVY